MKTVQFKDVSVGSEFTMNSIKYKKIDSIKISCCRSVNAHATSDASQKTFVQPATEVQIDD
jgi:hypothetical protein